MCISRNFSVPKLALKKIISFLNTSCLRCISSCINCSQHLRCSATQFQNVTLNLQIWETKSNTAFIILHYSIQYLINKVVLFSLGTLLLLLCASFQYIQSPFSELGRKQNCRFVEQGIPTLFLMAYWRKLFTLK